MTSLQHKNIWNYNYVFQEKLSNDTKDRYFSRPHLSHVLYISARGQSGDNKKFSPVEEVLQSEHVLSGFF